MQNGKIQIKFPEQVGLASSPNTTIKIYDNNEVSAPYETPMVPKQITLIHIF